jgi:hypothetical protein
VPLSVAATLERQTGRFGTSVATTTESAAGGFAFAERNLSPGKYTYRAVASDLAGYIQYGYSAARTATIG